MDRSEAPAAVSGFRLSTSGAFASLTSVKVTNLTSDVFDLPGFRLEVGASEVDLPNARYVADTELRVEVNTLYDRSKISVGEAPDGFPLRTAGEQEIALGLNPLENPDAPAGGSFNGGTVTHTITSEPAGSDEPPFKLAPTDEPPDDGAHVDIYVDSQTGQPTAKLQDNSVVPLGGSQPGVREYVARFTYETPDLFDAAVGAILFALGGAGSVKPGDWILDLQVWPGEPVMGPVAGDAPFDGTTPTFHYGFVDHGFAPGTSGHDAGGSGGMPSGALDATLSGNPQDGVIIPSPPTINTGFILGAFTGYWPIKVIAPVDFYVYIDDGSGGDPGCTQGVGYARLLVSTPQTFVPA